MTSNKNRLFYEIIIELLAIEEVPINNELQKYRRKLYYDIEQRMHQHAEDIKSLSHLQHNIRESELLHDKTEQVRLDKVMNYISHRDKYCKILDKQLKDNNDKHINFIIEKLRHVNMEINKLNDSHTKRSKPYTAAVYHSVKQAIKQDKIHLHAYNQKQHKKKFLVEEIESICKLEQEHITQFNEFKHQHIMRTNAAYQHTVYQQEAYQQAAYQHAAYQQAVNQHTTYQQTANPYTTYQEAVYQYKVYTQTVNQQPIYTQTANQQANYQQANYQQAANQQAIYTQAAYQQPIYTQATNEVQNQEQILKLNLEQELKLDVELDQEQILKLNLDQDLKPEENIDIWLNMID